MAQIGLALAGRHPGYEVFCRVNWFGPDPEDMNVRANSDGDTYVSAKLGREYDTYEYVVCNFISNGNRPEAFRIVLRVPHGYNILDAQNVQVSPTVVLEKVRQIISDNPLMRQGSTFRFPANVAYPTFPVGTLSQLLAEYRLEEHWGPVITMGGNENAVCYVEASAEEIPVMVMALPLCIRLSDVSEVFFGKFVATSGPKFSFSSAELAAQPQVQLNVHRRDGAVQSQPLNEPKEIRSIDYGYSPVAFNPVDVELNPIAVLDAYRAGRQVLPTPPGVSAVLKPATGEVELTFSPAPLVKTFRVNVVGVEEKEPFSNVALQSNLQSGHWAPVPTDGYSFAGEAITEFERNNQNSVLLAMHFRVAEGVNYRVARVNLSGDVITVTLKYEAPKPVVPPAPPSGDRADISLPPGSRDKERYAENKGKLFVHIPVNTPIHTEVVSVQCEIKDAPSDMYLARRLTFKPSGDSTFMYAEMEVPADLDPTTHKAYLGIPPYCETYITNAPYGAKVADFARCEKIGWFSKLSDMFVYKYDSYVSGGWKISRMFLPAVIGLLLILFGIIMGALLGTRLYNQITAEPAAIELSADEAEKALPETTTEAPK